jgi:hypothetical protein
MELINATRMAAEYTVAIDVSGGEPLVVVIDGTFQIPDKPGAALRLRDEHRSHARRRIRPLSPWSYPVEQR